MYIASGLLILSFGLTMLKFISCYSDGYILEEDQCRGMNINHEMNLPQNTEPPFNVHPENVTLTESEWRTSRINVVLTAKSSNFRGFMLDARTCDDDGDDRCNSVGTFSLDDTENSLLICGGHVVVQPNNLRKTSISVWWTPAGEGQFFFRAAFVESFSTFWRRKPIILPGGSTTPPPAEASAPTTTLPLTTKPTIFTTALHATGTSTAPPASEDNSTQTNLITSATIFTITSNTDSRTTGTSTAPPTSEDNSTQMTLTTTATIFTTTSNTDSRTTGTSLAPPTSEDNSTQTNPITSATIFKTSHIISQTTVTPKSSPQCVQYVRCVLALLLFSRLCFLGGSSLLIIRSVLKKMVTMSASILELASKTIAAIILIRAIKYECVYKCAGWQNVFTALTVTAMVSSLLHTITVFLHCGPSHELRKCWVCAIIMVDLMNTVITTTAIFFGIWCFEERWLSILMGVYVVWEIMLYLGSVCFEKMRKYQKRKKVKKNQNHILENRISPLLFMFIIFTIFNVMFTAALITGVSLVGMIN